MRFKSMKSAMKCRWFWRRLGGAIAVPFRLHQAVLTAILALTLVSWPVAAEAFVGEGPLPGSGQPVEVDERAADPEPEERHRGKHQARELPESSRPHPPGLRHCGGPNDIQPSRHDDPDGRLTHGLRAPPL